MTIGLFVACVRGLPMEVEVVLLGRQRRWGGVVQVEAWGFGWSLFVGDEHRHGDGGLQQAISGVLIVVTIEGIVV